MEMSKLKNSDNTVKETMSYSDALLTKSWYVENVWEHIYIEIAKKKMIIFMYYRDLIDLNFFRDGGR